MLEAPGEVYGSLTKVNFRYICPFYKGCIHLKLCFAKKNCSYPGSTLDRSVHHLRHTTLHMMTDNCVKEVKGLKAFSELSYLKAHCTNDPNMRQF